MQRGVEYDSIWRDGKSTQRLTLRAQSSEARWCYTGRPATARNAGAEDCIQQATTMSDKTPIQKEAGYLVERKGPLLASGRS